MAQRTVSAGVCNNCLQHEKRGRHLLHNNVKVKVEGKVRPGDALALLIKQLGYGKTSVCACAAMQRQMNEWGWLGCFGKRKEILQYLQEQARKVAVPFDEATVWAAFKALVFAVGHPKRMDGR